MAFHLFRRIYASLLGLGLAAASAASIAAPASACDPSLPSPANDPFRYRERDGRCEGRYAREVGNTALAIAGLTAGPVAAHLGRGGALRVAWPVVAGDAEVHVRAQGTRRRSYYRMDVFRPAAPGAWAWPTDLLAALALSPRADIGVVVSAHRRVGELERDVLLPARVGDTGVTAASYELQLLPGTQLDELFMTVSAVGPDGALAPTGITKVPTGLGYYPAERAIVLSIPFERLGAPGLYQVDLSAPLTVGGAAARTLWLQHGEQR